MKLSKHSAFLSICAINGGLWLLSCLIPKLPLALALDSNHMLRIFPWITAIFAHANFRHFFGNMLFVLPWAWYLEPRIGRNSFIAVWIASGLGGAFAWLLTPALFAGGASLGASAACMGVLGCAVMLMDEPLIIQLGALAILSVIGLQEYQLTVLTALIPDGIGHSAHIGGLLTGVVAAQLITARKLKLAAVKAKK